jgi:hypothetical protein
MKSLRRRQRFFISGGCLSRKAAQQTTSLAPSRRSALTSIASLGVTIPALWEVV